MARPIDPQRRAAILEAARTVFLEQGYAGARMAVIAERAGVASGTVYLYFSSKEALAAALADDFFVRLDIALRPILTQLNDPIAIRAAVETALEFAIAEHDLLRLLRLAVGLTPLAQALPGRRALAERLASALEAQMVAGKVQPYDARVLAELIMGLIEWMAEAALIRGIGKHEPYVSTVIDLLQRALLPSHSSAPSHS